MNKTFLSLGISLTLEELESLKGGTAEVSNTIEESSESGDGADLVCCIKIEFPPKNK